MKKPYKVKEKNKTKLKTYINNKPKLKKNDRHKRYNTSSTS